MSPLAMSAIHEAYCTDQRPIESEACPRVGQLLFAEDVDARIFAEDVLQRIAGQQSHGDKNEHSDAENSGYGKGQAS